MHFNNFHCLSSNFFQIQLVLTGIEQFKQFVGYFYLSIFHLQKSISRDKDFFAFFKSYLIKIWNLLFVWRRGQKEAFSIWKLYLCPVLLFQDISNILLLIGFKDDLSIRMKVNIIGLFFSRNNELGLFDFAERIFWKYRLVYNLSSRINYLHAKSMMLLISHL